MLSGDPRPPTARRALRAAGVALIVAMLAGLLWRPESAAPVAWAPLAGAFGLVAAVALTLLARALGRLLRRPEGRHHG